MHSMRVIKNISAIFIIILSIIVEPTSSYAMRTAPYAPSVIPVSSPVIITGYSFVGSTVEYVQIYNTSDEVVNLDGWTLNYTLSASGSTQQLVELHGLLKPKNYALAAERTVTTGDFAYTTASVPQTVSTLQLVPSPEYLPQSLTLKVDATTSFWRRNVSTTTGDYLSTFASFTPTADFTVYVGGLYSVPSEPRLQVSEILPNPRSCSPLDTALDCHEYVKLYNTGTEAIDMSQFRLRSGYQGQSATTGTAVVLAGVLEPGHFAVVTQGADGRTVSLSNSGGYVWIEDVYGFWRYDSTVQAYDDASSDTKKGHAWAYDAATDTWRWTSRPMPTDAVSVFPSVVASESLTLAALTPCKDGQYRSEATGRCRAIATANVALTPCAEDQERNPTTNRCRGVASSRELAPCAAGQERNPDTNRCRKIASTSMPSAGFAVESVADSTQAFVGWWALGGLTLLGTGYGVGEWRSEILAWLRSRMQRFPFVK